MIRWVISLLFTVLLSSQGFAAATLLPNGSQCFSATAPTSGGLSGPLTTLGSITGGSGYVNNVYTNVPLTGGSGFGATANITVTGNVVVNVTLVNPGSHYAAGDTLSAATANLGGSGSGFSVPVTAVSTTGTGMIGLLGVITGGSGGINGTYPGVALTGGSGSGATANITVSGGAVTAVVILNPGVQYAVGDTLSAASGNIGGVTGFSIPVSSVAVNQALAGGQVFMYLPNTTTPKQTWKNATQTILNTNPITLDQNGCAIIYGTGSYRQILTDALGNTVWDQLTTDTSAQQNVFWAGLAGGTANAITVVDPGFNATDGSIINFTALATNTTATTLNPSSFGNIPVVKDTSAGAQGLSGGEIVANNPVSVLYRSVDNSFHILNTLVNAITGTTGGAFYVSIVNFTGADPTGRTSSSAAFNSAVQACAILGGQTAPGCTIFVPPGSWLLSSNVQIAHSNIRILGAGQSSLIINGMTNQAAITFGDGITTYFSNGISSVTFAQQSGVTPTAGNAGLAWIKQGQGLIDAVATNNFPAALYNGITLTTVSQTPIRNIQVQNCLNVGVTITSGTDLYIAGSRSDANGADGWDITDTGGLYISDTTAFNNNGAAWKIFPTSGHNVNFFFRNTVGDTSGSYNWLISDLNTSSFTNIWGATQQSTAVNTFADGIILVGAAVHDVSFIGGTAINNNAHGVFLQNSSGMPTNIQFHGFNFGVTGQGNGRASGGGYGIDFDVGATNVSIIGGQSLGNATGAVFINNNNVLNIFQLVGYNGLPTTVAGLPTCSGPVDGIRAFVTDQNTPVAYRGAVTGAGAVHQAVLCSSGAWVQD